MACDDILHTPVAWFSGAMMTTFAISQTVIILMNKRWLRALHGVTLWRIWTIGNTQVAVVAWSSLVCYSIYYFDLSPTTIKIILICLGLAAAGGTSLAFDRINFYTYLAVILLPMTATFFVKGNLFLSLGTLLYLFYCSVTGMQIHNLAVSLTKKTEQLAKNLSNLRNNFEVIEAMLGSITESFIILNNDGVCIGKTSDIANKFFPNIREGVGLWDILELKGKDAEKIRSWYALLFMDRLDFQEIADRGPKMLELNNGALILKLKYHPLRDDNQKLKSVVFTANDVTSEMRSERYLEEEKERAAMILRINQNRHAFRAFLSNFETAVRTFQEQQPADNYDSVKRELHTLKGTAMFFGALTLSKRIYETELAVGKDSSGMLERIHTHGRSLAEYFVLWRHRENQLFTQIGVFDGETIEISKGKLLRVEAEFHDSKDLVESFRVLKEKLLAFEFGDLLRDFDFHINSVSIRLGKKVRFHLEEPSEPIYINAIDYREPLRAFIHLFNNALDHGLETPEERLRTGKQSEGLISVRYSKFLDGDNSMLRLEIEDDGRGINVAKLREKLRGAGKINVDQMSDLDVAAQIFRNGVSGRDQVSELSGQGVGMGAVREELLKVRGKIRIVRTGPIGTLFEVTLPDFSKSCQVPSAVSSVA
jgi:two-component system chemotaxis sensor kinase CheA